MKKPEISDQNKQPNQAENGATYVIVCIVVIALAIFLLFILKEMNPELLDRIDNINHN